MKRHTKLLGQCFSKIFFACIVLCQAATILAQPVSFTIVKDQPTDMLFLKSADMDLDGEIDLVYSQSSGINSFIAYGQGSGNFEAPVTISPPGASSIVLDYVNTDTLLDIIAVSYDEIYILENNGNRTFSTSSFSNSTSDFPFIASGFFNSDSYLDFVTSPAKMFFGDGSGNFPTNADISSDTLFGSDVSDFNKDGYDDLVVLEGSASTYARILLNDGNASFTESDSLPLGDLSISVSTNNALADFNNDGNPDFALITPIIGQTCSEVGFVSVGTVALGDGSGGIASVDTFSVCGTSYTMVTADVDGDLELDVIAANGSNRRLEVLLGNGDGTFAAPVPVNFNAMPLRVYFALSTADFDKDGNPDFVSGTAFTESDSLCSALNNAPDKLILADNMVTTGFTSVDFKIKNPEGREISRLKSTVAGSRFDRFDKNVDGALDVQTSDYNLQYGNYALVFKKKPDITSPATFDAQVRIGDSKLLKIFDNYETPGSARGSLPGDSIVFHLTIEQFPAIDPVSGETKFDNTPRFNWTGLFNSKSGSVDTYEFQLDSHFDFSAPLFDVSGLTSKLYTLATSLDRDDIYYWRVRSFDGMNYSNWSNEFAVYIGPFFCGDINNDGNGSNIVDLNYLVNLIFRGGPPAPIPAQADLNGDGTTGNIVDLNLLVNYMHRGASHPLCGT